MQWGHQLSQQRSLLTGSPSGKLAASLPWLTSSQAPIRHCQSTSPRPSGSAHRNQIIWRKYSHRQLYDNIIETIRVHGNALGLQLRLWSVQTTIVQGTPNCVMVLGNATSMGVSHISVKGSVPNSNLLAIQETTDYTLCHNIRQRIQDFFSVDSVCTFQHFTICFENSF